ncbi:exopolysaccharide biosynthesis polyprenyl glycosylphosphotransferase [Streptomyces sp. NPDC093109]|uniref:exopolysaccharide biosynthesis polyprenyl glycosylphosphotransferase n=1 Tax=Streptomyces sp. NPDC093109 TaxID=3154977 RepID=UPI00344B132A
MTTESTSVPPPSGRERTATTARRPDGPASAGRQTALSQAVRGRTAPGRVPIAPPRDTRGARELPDRLAPPARRRPSRSAFRFALPLLAADALAALLSTAVLTDEQRDAVLLLQLLACVTVLNALAGLYRPGVVLSGLDQLPALAARIAVAWCAAATVFAALFPANALGFTALLAAGAVQLAAACTGRSLIHTRRRAAARDRLRSALVVGTGPAARRITALLAQHPEYGLRPVGVASPAAPAPADPAKDGADTAKEGTRDSGGGGGAEALALPVLTTPEDIHRAIIQNGVQEALFTDGGDPVARAGLVTLFHTYGCATWFVGAGPWDLAAPPPAMERHLWGFGYHRVEPPATTRRRRGARAKRLLDLLLTAPVLVAVSPLLLLCALAVRLGDGPGVLFRQERVGQHGRSFTLLKFRTLRPSDDQESATRWNIANDRRMSPVGNLLRRTSLDELPQLWNVLRGDMSLVGPRPERPYFVANFSKTHPGYAARHRMPVGITGLAQVHGLRGDTSIEERSRFDNHYIDHWSLWQDVCIIVRTAVSLVRPAGS